MMGKFQPSGDSDVTCLNPQIDASKMLEAALQQIDGILDVARNDDSTIYSDNTTIVDAVNQLSSAIQCNGEIIHSDNLPRNSLKTIFHWVSKLLNSEDNGNFTENDEMEGKIQKLESEKNTLQLQVSVLSDQIEAQSNKIFDLEKMLLEKQQLLDETESVLRKELESRASFDASKLDMLNEMSVVKLRCTSVERENIALKDRVQAIENEKNKLAKDLQTKLSEEINEMTAEKDLSNSNHFGTMPRKKEVTINSPQKKGVAFGKGFSSLKLLRSSDTRCCSAPNLVDGVQVNPSDKHLALGPATLPPVPQQAGKQKKIKKIFSKWSGGSGPGLNLDNGDVDFKRGGVRATSLARLVSKDGRPDKPFQEWDCETVCNWVQDLGLNCYIHEVRNWCKDGAHFLNINQHQMEKELSIKNPLHRKKLELALTAERKDASDPLLIASGKLDYQFVVRWLDDIGLPQYKDLFLEARIDGRMLHTMTLEDLTSLKVVSVLHVTSVKRGIQVLRTQKFDPFCLKRRSTPQEDHSEMISDDIALWTNHRVMEWLRSVDLAEYAPNLRGSGVHGGLLVYESRFTADLLAQLLSIPANKSLLRRHLTNHFRDLVGKDIMTGKRYAESSSSFTPLSPTAKVKVSRRNVLFPKLKNKYEYDYEDLVCPFSEVPSVIS